MKLTEIISVSEYISVINEILSGVEARIEGEVSGLKKASSGHVYFMLKDEKGVLNCAIWKSIYMMCGVSLEEGMKVIVSGSSDVYPVRGTLTFKVRTVELAGEGALKKAYEELKKKLSTEGVFNNERKLPLYPKNIGVITSLRGAAIHDFVSNLGKFGFKIKACDARVEGQEAVADLISAVRTMKKEDIDVLVIIRGGGSIQSLIAFDNEMLVREIANFPVPVVAGVGHHEDITLVALAADVSESTPTAAANVIGKSYEKARESVLNKEEKIKNKFEELFYKKERDLERLMNKISFFFNAIIEKWKKKERKVIQTLFTISISLRQKKEELHLLKKKLIESLFLSLKNKKEKLEYISQVITSNDPQRQLRLGYSITYKKGKVQKSVLPLKKGEDMEVFFSDGSADVKIIEKHVTKNRS